MRKRGDERSEPPARAAPQSHGRKSVVRGLLTTRVYPFVLLRASSEPPIEILRGVYPEPPIEILRFAQNDRGRRAQNDRGRRAQNDGEPRAQNDISTSGGLPNGT